MKLDLSILDQLIEDEVAFAVYRLPASQEIHLILQKDRDVYQTTRFEDLGMKKGFVVAPFRLSNSCPIVIIRPDIHLKNQSEIDSFAHNYISSIKIKEESSSLSEKSTTWEEYEKIFSSFQYFK